MNLFNYTRRESSEVCVGSVPLGASHPLRVQSMTTTPTAHVEASVAQCCRIAARGADYVRLTAQGTLEAEALRPIREELHRLGYTTPLVADVHFNPRVADVAATIVEKVRINPGNYVDAARTFKTLRYTDAEYAAELQKIEDRFVPFLRICKVHHTAIRIGVNHGSLSDRIMCRYGDTPEGIVESCMEFLRICVKENFHDVVISIKASNTVVMVCSVRLLVRVMEQEGMKFPLHLGVTEAGEGEDGRIKSAVGIGALLSDGIGDTLRVSLSEAPEEEVPVAKKLVDYLSKRAGHALIPGREMEGFDFVYPQRRSTNAVGNIGGTHVPVVIACRLNGQKSDGAMLPDYIYCGRSLPAKEARESCHYILDADVWTGEEGTYPVFSFNHLMFIAGCTAQIKFLFLPYGALNEEVRACLHLHPEVVVISQSNHQNRVGEHRAFIHELSVEQLKNPVVVFQLYAHSAAEKEDFQLESSADTGALLFDGLVDGLMLYNNVAAGGISDADTDNTAFSILQAARLRTTKTEYISCPGCGRTLYNLQEVIAQIKAATTGLKNLKIAIMGCIVNGPGEMADADYGYVGAARGKVSLYRGKECVEKNIPSEEAVEKLLDLLRKDGKLV
ncbi:MAG: 4-hydroxy-3-methylbut-2-en-1-yl diphosphate synthase [Bacteroidaceae bacterium]